MVETHGGGFHYVPDQKQPPQKIENTSWRFFESLEDRGNKLALVPDKDGHPAPRLTTFDKLQKFLEQCKCNHPDLLSAQNLADTFSQADSEKINYYSCLIPGNTSDREQPDEETLKALAEAMLDDSDPASELPAAYTYFGQFLAHDLTHMKKQENGNNETVWVNASNHALTFESLFGTLHAGGQSSAEWINEAGACLGQNQNIPTQIEPTFDLPRDIHNGQPRCVDPRADSNLALAQMHVLLVRFHQKLAKISEATEQDAKLETKRHIQAVVLTDYLPRLIPSDIYNSVLKEGRRVVAPDDAAEFLVPLEFAAAVFRFGHSMVRKVYSPWGLSWPIGAPDQYPEESASLGTLLHYTSNGEITKNHLEYYWGQFWRHWVDMKLVGKENSNVFAAPISTRINSDLGKIPKANFPHIKTDGETFNLPLQTLLRGSKFSLPSGQEVAEFLGEKQTLDVKAFLDKDPRFAEVASSSILHEHTPLWFYTLAEAEGSPEGKLGSVAARVVMETFHAALDADHEGILRFMDNNANLDFKIRIPTQSETNSHITLTDIVKFVYGPQ